MFAELKCVTDSTPIFLHQTTLMISTSSWKMISVGFAVFTQVATSECRHLRWSC